MSAVAALEAVFRHDRAVELDDRDEFPVQACGDLDDWGLHHFYVPSRFGGRLTSFEELLGLIRVVARRDVTVAVAHGKTLLGSISAWVAAEPGQAERLARQILAGAAVSWGLTEREHGGDLLAGEVTARLEDGRYRIDGEKWPINNATRGSIMAVLARTSPDGGPRGFDVLLVDRRQLAPGTYRCLPKELTHGIRGADISGIVYTGALVPENARVGAPGSGLETVLRGLQLTRTMCAGLSLGAGEHALKLAVRLAPELSCADAPARSHADARTDPDALFGTDPDVFAETHPDTRAETDPDTRAGTHPDAFAGTGPDGLAHAYADLLAAEALAIAGSRSIHFLPGELSVLSAMVKYLVPTWVDAAIATVTRLIGQRAVEDPMLAKVGRDAAIVGLFDGSTVVNLNAVINQFPLLSRPRPGCRVPELYDVRAPLPEFDRDRLALLSTRGVSLLNGLAEAVPLLEPGPQAHLGQRLLNHLDALRTELAALPPARLEIPAAHYETAARLTTCAAGAAAIEVWLANRHHTGGTLWHDGAWLSAVLARVLTRLGDRQPADPVRDRTLRTALQEQVRTGRPISLFEEPR